jgi:hypothetical protein
MKYIVISRPLQAFLGAVVALTLVALMKTEPLDPRDGTIAGPRSTTRLDTTHGDPAPEVLPAWERPAREMSEPDPVSPAAPVVAPMADSAARRTIATSPEAPPSVPSAPDHGLVYLGRIEQDRRLYVFLGRGSVPQVIEVGSAVDAQWKVERATATQVDLRHLPSNDLRSIAIR